MLDTDTKHRIDTARDILVGKVPDPKSQVEQITIALIYKFMDDMDAEAEELGCKRKFFTGDFARYGWAKLMSKGLGGHDLIALYGEGISIMPQNPGIPVLFRDIFKNAYLPYRDPETLKNFLKIINEFSYDHSERLGDAFEYLLSVLGSQGDAGQFRTPRHIIDFIVEVLAPKKNEVILDPACGTAGFLISAYKHILRQNSSPLHQAGEAASKPFGLSLSKGKDAAQASTSSARTERVGDLLTPDEKGQLAQNFKGYDISPDMVRLSLVNLYLHGFTDPHIFEYDTLTSEDRWNEYADVILANPPFMSPKGGIKPHKRFSIQAKRSEVLFVDYMAEHLTPTGRAGIIVPEGIIFQSQTAYKALRKMLVENSLVAVISLPAGCFNPYSGVKTSILILDKSLARQSDSVAFFKVENDGYGLGAQRRANAGGQLTQVQAELAEYLQALRNHQPTDSLQPTLGLIVAKEKIAANGEYNLSMERYLEGVASFTTYPLVTLEDVFTKISNGVNVTQVDEKAKYRVSRIQTIADGSVNLEKTKFTDDEVKPESFLHMGDILLSHINSFDHLGKAAIFLVNDVDVIHGINLIRLVPDTSRIDPRYAIRVFKTDHFIDTVKSFAQKAVNQASVKTSDLRAIQIPLPPLEVQQEIVAEIEGYQKVIDGARAVVDNYRPHIPIHPDWPMVEISEVSERITKGSSPNWQGINYTTEENGILFVTSENVGLGQLLLEKPKYVESRFNEIEPKSILQKGDVLTNIVGASIGRTAIFDLDIVANVNQAVCVIRPNSSLVNSTYLMTLLNSSAFIEKLLGNSVENARANVSMGVLGSLTIPLPDIATQQAIVAEIEAEQALVAANRELIARFEKKIQTTLARVWGDEESTPPEQ